MTTTAGPVQVGAVQADVLDVALDRVRELSLRLWAVRAAHTPVPSRLRGVRCGTCGQAFPCRTVLAAGPQPVDRAVPQVLRP